MNDEKNMEAKAFLESYRDHSKTVQKMHKIQRSVIRWTSTESNYENTGAVNATRKTDAMAEMIAEMVDFESEMKQEECRLLQ